MINSILDKVATCSYNYYMQKFKAVGVKNLKNNLSAYLREVKSGQRILVTEHEQVIAELREPSALTHEETQNSLLATWILEGKVQPARIPKSERTKMQVTTCNLPEGTAQRLLDEVRGD